MAGAAIVFTAASAFAASAPVIKKVTSTTWAGYAAIGAPGTYTTASAHWTVPEIASCPDTGDQYSVAWVGIDGAGGINNHVQQVGTEQSCYSGRAVYRAFYEVFPNPPVFIKGFNVRPGDEITAAVTSLGNGNYQFELGNADNERHFSAAVGVPTGGRIVPTYGQSAEAIFEAPAGAVQAPAIQAISFSDVRFNGATLGSYGQLFAVAMVRGYDALGHPILPPAYYPRAIGADGASFLVAVPGYTPPAADPDDQGDDSSLFAHDGVFEHP